MVEVSGSSDQAYLGLLYLVFHRAQDKIK